MSLLSKSKRLSSLVLSFLMINLLWYLAAIVLQRTILPDPLLVYQNLPSLFQDQLLTHISYSLFRVLLGMSIALTIGFLLGVLMGRFSFWNRFLDPIVYLTYPVPKLALLPVIMLLFGLGESSKIIMVILIILPQVTLAVRDAVKNIPKSMYYIFDCIQANKWNKFRYITFPSSMAEVLTSGRISLGTAISVLFFTENYGTEYGMGYVIMDFWLRMDYLSMYGAILLLSFIGFLLFFLIDALEWKLLKWKQAASV